MDKKSRNKDTSSPEEKKKRSDDKRQTPTSPIDRKGSNSSIDKKLEDKKKEEKRKEEEKKKKEDKKKKEEDKRRKEEEKKKKKEKPKKKTPNGFTLRFFGRGKNLEAEKPAELTPIEKKRISSFRKSSRTLSTALAKCGPVVLGEQKIDLNLFRASFECRAVCSKENSKLIKQLVAKLIPFSTSMEGINLLKAKKKKN